MLNRVLGAIALTVATAASATPVTVQFTGSMAGAGFFAGGFSTSDSAYLQAQNDFLHAGTVPGATYDFTFSYDTSVAGSNPGSAGYTFPVTLVSGRYGSYTDFSGFTATMYESGAAGHQQVMSIQLSREDLFIPANFNRFSSFVTFTMVDNQGLIYSAPTTAPASIDNASLEQRNAEFRTTGPNGNYRYLVSSFTVGTTDAPVGVPEPGMLALFGLGAGAMALRRRGQRSSSQAVAIAS